MKNTIKKLLSIALVLLLFATAPMGALAELESLSLGELFAVEVKAVSSGNFGASQKWVFDKGTLIISGTGYMTDWTHTDDVPWYSNRDDIKCVTIEDGIRNIGDHAFSQCSALTKIEIPNSVTSIGNGAFSLCYSITSIEIPDSVTSIGDSAFSGCKMLKSITLPDSVENIGSGAFGGCKALKSITVPDSVTSMGDGVFSDCTYLESATIGNNIDNIGANAFRNCSKLIELTIPASAKIFDSSTQGTLNNFYNYGAFYNCEGIEKITLTKGNGMMQNYRSSIEVNGVNPVLGSDTYYQETPWYVSRNSLKEIIIEDGIKNIGSSAFLGCENLTSVSISNSVTSIGERAFEKCFKLSDVYYNGTEEQWDRVYIGLSNDSLTDATIHFHTHSYTSSVTKAPTCTQTGIRTYTCSCNDSYTEVIPVIAHNLGSWEIVTSATCKQTGEKVKKCTSCKNIIERETIAKTAHTPSDWQITAVATCTQTGTKVKVCTGCSTTLESQTIPKAEHSLGDWEITVQPTEDTTGKKVKKCTACKNVIEEEIIPKLGATVTIQNYPTTIFYKESSIIRVVGENLPSNAKINWSVSGGTVELSPSADSKSCSIRFLDTGDIKITATVDGTTVSDTVTVKVKYSWWQWIIIILLFGWIWY